MRHGSLFSGIGGFDLAASWMGWENVFQVENDKFCTKVLEKNFPNTKRYGDIKEFDGKQYRGAIDILTGGDPCQPHSVAGLGKGQGDDRYLWPEMFRIIQELDVPWIVNENVTGSISNGVLDLKIDDLESVGYSCQAYCIPAEAVGGLHQRERVWLIAYNADSNTNHKISSRVFETEGAKQTLEIEQYSLYKFGEPVDLRDDNSFADIERFKKQYPTEKPRTFAQGVSRYFGFGTDPYGHIPRNIIKSGIIRMLNGLLQGMDYADRSKRIKGLGNAIVPQVAFEIFKSIASVATQE